MAPVVRGAAGGASRVEVLVHDGVAVLGRGDVFIVVYQLDARLHRTRWLFDRLDEFVATLGEGTAMGFMVVLPTAGPPDAPTRTGNVHRPRKVGARLRRIVTTPIGDSFLTSVVRTVMRGLSILQGQAKVQIVSNTIDEGITRLLEISSPATPTRTQLLADLEAMHAALGAQGVSPWPSLRAS